MSSLPRRHTTSDKDLVVAFQRGEPEAFATIYRRYRPQVHVVCLRLLRHPHDAEEAAQETFAKAYAALPNFNGRYLLEPWLRRIAANVCLDELRSRARTPNVVALSSTLDPFDSQPGPESLLVGDGTSVGETVQDLPPAYAAALRLRVEQGLSYKEIASRLSMTPNQVKSLLHRARTSFRRAWKEVEGWALLPLSLAERWRWIRPQSIGSPSGATLEQTTTAVLLAVAIAVAPYAPNEGPRMMPGDNRGRTTKVEVGKVNASAPEAVMRARIVSAASERARRAREVVDESTHSSKKNASEKKQKPGKLKDPGYAALASAGKGKGPALPPALEKAPGGAVAKAARLLRDAEHGAGKPSVVKIAKGLSKKK